jgi:hypothetical protein
MEVEWIKISGKLSVPKTFWSFEKTTDELLKGFIDQPMPHGFYNYISPEWRISDQESNGNLVAFVLTHERYSGAYQDVVYLWNKSTGKGIMIGEPETVGRFGHYRFLLKKGKREVIILTQMLKSGREEKTTLSKKGGKRISYCFMGGRYEHYWKF